MNNKEETNTDSVNDGAKGIKIFEALLLPVPLCNEMSLVAINGTINMIFESEDPLDAEHVHLGWTRDEKPGLSVNKSAIFKLHRLAPHGIRGSLGKVESFQMSVGDGSDC